MQRSMQKMTSEQTRMSGTKILMLSFKSQARKESGPQQVMKCYSEGLGASVSVIDHCFAEKENNHI